MPVKRSGKGVVKRRATTASSCEQKMRRSFAVNIQSYISTFRARSGIPGLNPDPLYLQIA